MSFEDFLTHFDAVEIAKIRTHCSWSELRLPMKLGRIHDEWDKAVRIFVEESAEMCFSLFQQGARTEADLADLLICVHKMNSNETVGELVARSPRKVGGFVSTGDVILCNGEYIVLGHSFKTLGFMKIHGNVVVYSSRPVYVKQVDAEPDKHTDSLVEILLKEGKYNQLMDGVICRTLSTSDNFAGLIVLVDNLMEDHWVHTRTECNGSNVLSSRGALEVSDAVPPCSRQITIILTQCEKDQNMTSSYATRVTKTNSQVLDGNVPNIPPFSSIGESIVHTATFIQRNYWQ